MTAEGVVGALMSVIHTRLLAQKRQSAPALTEMQGQLMSLIVLPYLGSAAARRELTRPTPAAVVRIPVGEPSKISVGLGATLTYRTTRVLKVIAEHPGANNREVAEQAGIVDQGQISRLLRRLEQLGLIANTSDGTTRGAPNAWLLTAKGQQVEQGVPRPGYPQLHPLNG